MGPSSAASAPVIDWLDESEWIFEPSQSRSRDSLSKVLLSAKRLFVERGYDETTVADISRDAQVSVGSIYHRFKDKQSILYAVLDSYTRTRFAQVGDLTRPQRWQHRSAADVLDFHIEIIFSSARRDTGLYRLMERQRMIDPRISDLQIKSDEYICGLLTGLYRLYADELAVADLATAVRYVHLVTRGSVLWSILSAPAGAPPLDIFGDEFRRESRQMAARYLGLSTPAS
ncbi:MAG: TetR/AcrR family transcriptional regulator [Parahaliea sp.]